MSLLLIGLISFVLIQEVPQGETGEILVSSPSMCQGYLSGDNNTQTITWLHTDDAGYFGCDGKLYLQGRRSDAILRGAYILYPGWLEDKLKSAWRSADVTSGVQDVAVVSVPDRVLHHEICACVVVRGVEQTVAGRGHLGEDCREQTDQMCGTQRVDGVSGQNCEDVCTRDCRINAGEREQKQEFEQSATSSLMTSNVSSCRGLDVFDLESRLRDFVETEVYVSEAGSMKMAPRYYIFMENFPLTGTGKLDRKELRRIAKTLLHLDSD